ncbi:MAG: UDP-N-acetylglucosamine 2-epimerase (non-hydrolyzing) [Candidatus Thorarchaeota archaeon]
MLKVAVAIGTRPEIVKMWSVLRELRSRDCIETIVIHTNQHYDYEMSRIFFEELALSEPDYHLGVGSHTPVLQTTETASRTVDVLSKEGVDLVLVQGDTNTALGCALAASLTGVALGHVEAGCRSFDRTMPEENNRIIIDSIADLMFASSETAYYNLIREGRGPERTELVGNTALEALKEGLRLTASRKPPYEDPYCVATIHRPSNTDSRDRLKNIVRALDRLPIKCVFPVHPRTMKQMRRFHIEPGPSSNLELIAPMGYVSFVNLLVNSRLVITDSGGVQEEAALLGKQTITVRNSTEWPETIWSGLNRLVAADDEAIVKAAHDALQTTRVTTPVTYQEGAGRRIVDKIVQVYKEGCLKQREPTEPSGGYPTVRITHVREARVLMAFDGQGYLTHGPGAEHYLVEDSVPYHHCATHGDSV